MGDLPVPDLSHQGPPGPSIVPQGGPGAAGPGYPHSARPGRPRRGLQPGGLPLHPLPKSKGGASRGCRQVCAVTCRSHQCWPGPPERPWGTRAEHGGTWTPRSGCGEPGSPERPGFGRGRCPVLLPPGWGQESGDGDGARRGKPRQGPLLIQPGTHTRPCVPKPAAAGPCPQRCLSPHPPSAAAGLGAVAGRSASPTAAGVPPACARVPPGLTCWTGVWVSPFPPRG